MLFLITDMHSSVADIGHVKYVFVTPARFIDVKFHLVNRQIHKRLLWKNTCKHLHTVYLDYSVIYVDPPVQIITLPVEKQQKNL